MYDYEHFRPYLHSQNLGWSYGAMKGRDDPWQRQVSGEPVDLLLSDVKARGFAALYINRLSYADGAADLERQWLSSAYFKAIELPQRDN